MIGAIITILGGIVAASSLIIAKKPNAKEWIDKLVPYQGAIGVLMSLWGAWELLRVVTHLGLLANAPVRWLFWLSLAVANLAVGFLLGFALISKFVLSKNDQAIAKGQALRVALIKFQVPLGVMAIVVGVIYLLI